jgi:hypothetical protein
MVSGEPDQAASEQSGAGYLSLGREHVQGRLSPAGGIVRLRDNKAVSIPRVKTRPHAAKWLE